MEEVLLAIPNGPRDGLGGNTGGNAYVNDACEVVSVAGTVTGGDGGSDRQDRPVLTYDEYADAAYIRLGLWGQRKATTQVVVEGVPAPADIVLDFTDDGILIGVEIIGAAAVLLPEILENSIRYPPGPKQV